MWVGVINPPQPGPAQYSTTVDTRQGTVRPREHVTSTWPQLRHFNTALDTSLSWVACFLHYILLGRPVWQHQSPPLAQAGAGRNLLVAKSPEWSL